MDDAYQLDAHGPEAVTSVVTDEEPPLPPLRPGRARRRPRKLEGTELLARYEVESVLGQGGMATVYRGRHKTIEKPVAIKVLDGAIEGIPDAIERFLQEARVTSRVIHENVVEVTDFGITAEGVVFCVMELLHGETLGDLVDAEGPLAPTRAAAIMRQICSALQAAHDHGIIHRDLKPDNCFRTPRTSDQDFIKVLDFGIARVTAAASQTVARPRRTEIGCIVGTPDYMAPEQARAEDFDHRVDVYAAGGVLFELLTGRRPYLGNSAAELLAAHIHLPVPDPGELVPSLCPELRAVVRKAMAKDPDDRYPSMVALSQAITQAVRAQARQRTTFHRVVQHASMVVAASALLFGYGALRESPPEHASIGLGELASPHIVLAMQPRGAAEDTVAGIVADDTRVEPSVEVPAKAESPLLAEMLSDKLREPSVAQPRRHSKRAAVADSPRPIEPPAAEAEAAAIVDEAPAADEAAAPAALPDVTHEPEAHVEEDPAAPAPPARVRRKVNDLKDPFVRPNET